MIEQATVAYVMLTFIFLFNFVCSTAMVMMVVSRLKNLHPVTYWSFFSILTAEGIVALVSFWVVLSPDERLAGVPLSIVLNGVYAGVLAALYIAVMHMHLTTGKWTKGDANG
jgi:uncharacterized membrane protein (DUF4010 family)